MKRLNIIGCGSLGSVLARLWRRTATLEIGDILNRSQRSAEAAVAFIGGGRAIGRIDLMQPAGFYLIATPDDAIAEAAQRLAGSGLLNEGDIVFHCSGALPATILNATTAAGAEVVSVHPIRSFADRERAAASFAGTFCGIEGAAGAVEAVGPLFTAIGGQLLPIDSAAKTLYHGAGVIVCNYLTALMEVGVRAYGKAGIDRETALRVMAPIVRGTVENIFVDGTTDALTGPIARGDVDTVSRQLADISAWNPAVGEVYRCLGQVAVDLARQKGAASPKTLDRIQELFGKSEEAKP